MTNDEPRLLGDYVTRREHGTYPVGSKCVAYSKPNDILLLKMEDGGEVELDARCYYCPDLTPARRMNPIIAEICEIMDAQVRTDIDRVIFGE